MRYGELYSLNYCIEVKERDRAYYEVYTLPRTADVPEGIGSLPLFVYALTGPLRYQGR